MNAKTKILVVDDEAPVRLMLTGDSVTKDVDASFDAGIDGWPDLDGGAGKR